jgi:S1-C subfamily serine protease
MDNSTKLRLLPLAFWASFSVFAQTTPRGTENLEALLLGNHARSSSPNKQNLPEGDASIKALTQDDAGFSRGAKAIANTRSDALPQGQMGARIYQDYSRSVVLVITRDGIGSGVLIDQSGRIITNWHVLNRNRDVGVIFKPQMEGQSLNKNDLIRATVVKVDEVADLAVLRVDRIPSGIVPVPLGSIADVVVGADVHAIGHPTGEAWTYTKGVVSQIRQAYNWKTTDSAVEHKANVIQTQTPINPGNSGGPLISDTGRLVGINSFMVGGQGLNFAVSVDELKRFLSSSGNRYASASGVQQKNAASRECKVREIYNHPNKDDTVEIRGYDTDCDGKAELEVHKPYDVRKPISIVIDENKDGHPDQVIIDSDRDGKWDFSLHDTNFDGKWDLIGYHPDGAIKPSRYEPYRD